MLSKDPKYSLKEQLAKWIRNHPDGYLLMTDVKKFYESLSSKIALGVIFKIVHDPYLRSLFAEILLSLPYMPLGDSLSPTVANLTMAEVDKLILAKFKPSFFAAFGDNRIYGVVCDKQKLYKIKEFADIYYDARYNIKLKHDWQIVSTRDEFSFCKLKFKPGFTHVRASIRSHACKVSYIQERFAGYKGMFMATDGQSFLRKCRDKKNLRARSGQRIPDFTGKHVEMDVLVGKSLYLANYRRIENDKPSQYYYRFMFICKDEGEIYQTSNGSQLIKDAMEQIENLEGGYKKPLHVVKLTGGAFAFKEFVVEKKEVIDVLFRELGFEE